MFKPFACRLCGAPLTWAERIRCQLRGVVTLSFISTVGAQRTEQLQWVCDRCVRMYGEKVEPTPEPAPQTGPEPQRRPLEQRPVTE